MGEPTFMVYNMCLHANKLRRGQRIYKVRIIHVFSHQPYSMHSI